MTQLERTLLLVKPDGVTEGHIGDIIHRLEEKHYTISALKVVTATEDQLKNHYSDKVDKPFFKEITSYMQEDHLVAIVASGVNIIKTVHHMAGNTNPDEAQPGTIRGDYSHDWSDGILRNTVHTSDSVTDAEKEIQIWFPNLEV
ncbi:nucleoside-diphosphate kinase [Levilactobacillus bambusae]|uniref:Nucleoside diphosphate kinase n=1 Tax=Levilactobacillus bambusae TaxID=2024736 RepID=A0A2V1N0A4_9LACO|nr:nucleoside-diphosphate kinase [Levilactobacillus bambusae]PWG00701.1 nucleoside-diphosphate kinase [Levilactobacillus bambusae]